MITSTHAIVYADDAEAARAFFRDVLELPYVDAHDGWLLFKLPPAELGVHPSGPGFAGGTHELYLMCDDLAATMDELAAKGVTFAGQPQQAGWGTVVSVDIPGGGTIGLYQPRHAPAWNL
jgi:catechol 2,3-dioxygenase-like lactoylglutathione lyase family enzyme